MMELKFRAWHKPTQLMGGVVIMNRKQRRAKGVQYVSPIIKKFKAEDIIATTMYIPMIVLRDKYGFGRKRLGDFLEEIIDQMKFIEEGYVTTKDMQRTITEETGIRFDRR